MDHDNYYSTPRYIQVQVSTIRSSSVDVIHTVVINLKLVDVLQADGIAPRSTSSNREVTPECDSKEARIRLLKVVFTSTQGNLLTLMSRKRYVFLKANNTRNANVAMLTFRGRGSNGIDPSQSIARSLI